VENRQKGGGIMVNEEIIMIKDRLRSAIHPKQIYLFGSFAKDTYTAESDYDFYVVMADDTKDTIAISQKAYKSLRGIRKRPVDIVVSCESSFQRRKELDTLEKNVAKEGVLLYGE
jgi:predicted nucleotidyltransferase